MLNEKQALEIIDLDKKFKAFKEEEIQTGSHWTRRGSLENSDKVWYCKIMRDNDAAKREVLAQEFFRLLIPHQPETYLARDKYGSLYVISESVPGFHQLPLNQQQNFMDGTITGLGQAMACALFLEETDLKNGNIGLDDKNRVIKIDGDWCFSELKKDEVQEFESPFKLSAKAIESLPYPADFPTFEWLDYTLKWKKNPTSQIVNTELSDSKQFRAEVNETFLKICLLPDSFLEAFAEFYIPGNGKPHSDLMKSRRDELKQSLLKNESFINYLKSPEAKNAETALIGQMKSFESGGKAVIDPDLKARLTKEIRQLESLNKIFLDYQTCNQLIKSLEGEVKPRDALLAQFILDKTKSIEENTFLPGELEKNLTEIQEALDAMSSAEFKAVITTIASFRANIGFFMDSKAETIERALYNTPINERSTLISNPTANDVQRALAAHRHPLRDNPESSGKIDYDKAATAYRTLKDRFSPIEVSSDEQEELQSSNRAPK